MAGSNCVKLTNNTSYFEKIPNSGTKNTYSALFMKAVNRLSGPVHNIGITLFPAISIIYDSGNKTLIMRKENDVAKSIHRLDEIGRLPCDWNGYGAKPFSSLLIHKCESIVNVLMHQPEIYPTGRQSIQFQYELKDRSYLEFEIFEHKTMCLCVPKRIYSDAKTMEITDSEEENIREIVDRFYGEYGSEG